MRIYTRTGDGGETGLFGGDRVPKDHPRVVAYGEADELNALLGVALAALVHHDLRATLTHIQEQLFVVGADLATPHPAGDRVGRKPVTRLTADAVRALEETIDHYSQGLPELRHFILPGGSLAGAVIHLARAACRRAERAVVTLARQETVNPHLVPYLNRLSDLLFVLARVANHRAGEPEHPWQPETNAPPA